jgi:hypothetical protein
MRACGYAALEMLVICLDAQGGMAEAEQLSMLARIRHGAIVQVGSTFTSRQVSRVLTAAGPEYRDQPIRIVRFPDCVGECDLRIEVHGGSRG